MSQNVGCYVCKNYALMLCKGDWITFQDADDVSHYHRLEIQLKTCLSRHKKACYVSFLSRKTNQFMYAPITLFINASFFRNYIGCFHSVRFGADSELKARLDAFFMHEYVIISKVLYFCLDRWMEIHPECIGRKQSLTNSSDTFTIRTLYTKAFQNRYYKNPALQSGCFYTIHSNPYHNLPLTEGQKKIFGIPFDASIQIIDLNEVVEK
jgi:glycosyltransferase involved in cell wall biosynthesis